MKSKIKFLLKKYKENLKDVQEVMDYDPEDMEAMAQIEILDSIINDLKLILDN